MSQDGFSERQKLNSLVFDMQEREVPHNPYDLEARKLACVRDGNPEQLVIYQNEAWEGEYGKVGEDPVRQEKNLAIITAVLASRAAIQGGMSPELAFSMADSYILHIEKMTQPEQIRRASYQYEVEFAKCVRELNRPLNKNHYVEQAKDYIFKHLHGRLQVADVSGHLGLNRDYLSDLFHRSEGVTMQYYIRREKIRQAENMLRYSDYQIHEIANYLAFSSQSHFASCFKKETGMTPIQYRNQYAKI